MCQSPTPQSKKLLMTIHQTTLMPPAIISPSPTKEIESIDIMAPPLQQQKRRKRVRFSDAQVVGTSINRLNISVEESQNLWYFANELNEFKSEIRDACQRIREDRLENDNSVVLTNYDAPDFLTRGLEGRICKNRQRNKALAVWGTLKAQQRNKDPEFIAMIARKCSSTSTQLAYMEACRDYCEIYNPEASASLTTQIEAFSSQSFPIKLKRKLNQSSSARTSSNTNSRNVRIRITWTGWTLQISFSTHDLYYNHRTNFPIQ